MTSAQPIQVEIWSDVQCPFCYIGKRQFETALKDFADKDTVEIVWRSYQLDPDLKPQGRESIYEYLARRKGMTVEQSRTMHQRVAQTAESVGLNYHFDRMIVANSHAAHRLIQLSKSKGLGDAAEEALFRAYFTQGKDLGDQQHLREIATSVGLSDEEAAEAWNDPQGTWRAKVDAEAAEAAELGSTGVPFFVFQRRYAVTGAQGAATFAKVLQTLSQERKTSQP